MSAEKARRKAAVWLAKATIADAEDAEWYVSHAAWLLKIAAAKGAKGGK